MVFYASTTSWDHQLTSPGTAFGRQLPAFSAVGYWTNRWMSALAMASAKVRYSATVMLENAMSA